MNPTTGNLPFRTALILSQASLRSDRYGAFACFETLKIELGGVVEHSLTIANQMLAEMNRQFNSVLVQQISQQLFSLKLWPCAKVRAIEPKKIKRVILQSFLA